MKCEKCKTDTRLLLDNAKMTSDLVGHHVRVQKMGFELLENVINRATLEKESDKEAGLAMIKTMERMNTLLIALTSNKGLRKVINETDPEEIQEELFKEEN